MSDKRIRNQTRHSCSGKDSSRRLLSVFGADSFTIKELVELMPTNTEISQVLPDELADDERKGSMQRRLGRA